MSRILIVDDSKYIRSNLLQIFSLMGFEAIVAGSGSEALDQFYSVTFDLVITDLEMPGMDGWTLSSQIKELSPDTPIVLITGSEKSDLIERLETSNVDLVLFKPFSLKDIQDTVQTALARKAIESGKG